MNEAIPGSARAYATLVTLAAAAVLVIAALNWRSHDPVAYASFFLLALAASTLKIRLPGFTGTMSVSFLFILIGVADFSLAETVAMGSAAALVQSLWRPRQRPSVLQVLFNVATVTVSSALAYQGAHSLMAAAGARSLPVLLPLAACLYLVANTLLVSIIISLTEGRRLLPVWQRCYRWAFPYFAAGAALAGLVCASCRTVGWQVSLLVLPTAYLLYIYYRIHVEQRVPEEVQ
jgi:hypothetical protein